MWIHAIQGLVCVCSSVQGGIGTVRFESTLPAVMPAAAHLASCLSTTFLSNNQISPWSDYMFIYSLTQSTEAFHTDLSFTPLQIYHNWLPFGRRFQELVQGERVFIGYRGFSVWVTISFSIWPSRLSPWCFSPQCPPHTMAPTPSSCLLAWLGLLQ